MRDIRDDLRERLDALAADRLRLQERLASIEALENSVKLTLREEEVRIARLSVDHAELPFPNGNALEPSAFVGGLIKRVLKNRNRPLEMEEIRDEIEKAEAYDFAGKKPGRVIHFGLVSLKKGGEVIQLPDGRWAFPAGNGTPVQGKTA